MASQYHRLLDSMPISGTKSQDREQVFDAGAYKQVNVEFIFMAAGTLTSGSTLTLTLQHASANEDGLFMDVKDVDGNTVQINLLGTPDNSYHQVEGFLRYLRWDIGGDGVVNAQPIAGMDLVAKE